MDSARAAGDKQMKAFQPETRPVPGFHLLLRKGEWQTSSGIRHGELFPGVGRGLAYFNSGHTHRLCNFTESPIQLFLVRFYGVDVSGKV